MENRLGRRGVAVACFLLLAASAMGCAGKAASAKPAGFVSSEGMRHNPKLPFHRIWRDRSFDFESRRHLHIAAVNTEYLLTHTWWQGFARGSQAHVDAADLGIEFRQRVIAEFREDPAHRFSVVDDAALDGLRDITIIPELAIVDLVPNKALIQSLTYPAGPFGLLAGQGMDALGSTSIAMEGRVRDGATGEIVLTVADREMNKSGLLNIKNFTWYAHVREIIEEWALQFRLVANKPPDVTIPDSAAWRLLPW